MSRIRVRGAVYPVYDRSRPSCHAIWSDGGAEPAEQEYRDAELHRDHQVGATAFPYGEFGDLVFHFPQYLRSERRWDRRADSFGDCFAIDRHRLRTIAKGDLSRGFREHRKMRV